jgi:hypothetical protein
MAVLPGPAPKENDVFPPNKSYYEIPIAIQDRAFRSDGSLFYPDSRSYSMMLMGMNPFHPRKRPGPDLEPGVLREHDHGQRQHLAFRAGGA